MTFFHGLWYEEISAFDFSIVYYWFCRLTSGVIRIKSCCMILTPDILQISFAPNLFQKHVMKWQPLEQEMQRYTFHFPFIKIVSYSYYIGYFSEELLILFQVRVFNMSRLSGRRPREISMEPAAVYQCHSRRVKKLAVSYHTDGPLFILEFWNSFCPL